MLRQHIQKLHIEQHSSRTLHVTQTDPIHELRAENGTLHSQTFCTQAKKPGENRSRAHSLTHGAGGVCAHTDAEAGGSAAPP